jgi:hypothetical protein
MKRPTMKLTTIRLILHGSAGDLAWSIRPSPELGKESDLGTVQSGPAA